MKPIVCAERTEWFDLTSIYHHPGKNPMKF
jgi:hypothetical protein